MKSIDELVAEWEKDPERKAGLELARERIRSMGGAAALMGMMVPVQAIMAGAEE